MVFAFGDSVLDVNRRELRRGGDPVSLEPQVFDLLAYLIRKRERVVGKDELIASIWGGRIVSDSALTTRINAARKAVGDSGAEQRLIKTFPRKGVRFVGVVRETEHTAAPATRRIDDVPPEPTASRDFRIRPRGVLSPLAAILLLALVAAGLTFYRYGRNDAGPSLPGRPSIAVLPFNNLSGDPGQDYLSDGVTEDIITALSKFSGLFVIARNSSFRFKNKSADVVQIGRELGVRYLLKGSIQKSGERIRITAQLIDASSGNQRWADRYDSELKDVFAVQDEVTQKIVITLAAYVTKAETERASRKPPQAWDAYDYYLQGRAAMAEFIRLRTTDSASNVAQLYERALAADPKYAPVYTALSELRVNLWLNQQNKASSTLDEAHSLALKAVDLDPLLPEAHAALGWVLHWQGHGQDALAEFRRALEFNPNLADSRYGEVLTQEGLPADALKEIDKSLRLDPLPQPIRFGYLGHAYYTLRQYRDAVEPLRECTRLSPALRPCHVRLAATYAQLGRRSEAMAEAATVLRIEPRFTITEWRSNMRYADPDQAKDLVDGLRAANLPE
jgi:TolB-like protein/DNA-binding winged helix-turn-helix (wHTH) protein